MKRDIIRINSKKLDDYLKENKISYSYINNVILNRSSGYMAGCMRNNKMSMNDYVILCKKLNLNYKDFIDEPINEHLFETYVPINIYRQRKNVTLDKEKFKEDVYKYYIKNNPGLDTYKVYDAYKYIGKFVNKSYAYIAGVTYSRRINFKVLQSIADLIGTNAEDYIVSEQQTIFAINQAAVDKNEKERQEKHNICNNIIINTGSTESNEYILIKKTDFLDIAKSIQDLETQLITIKSRLGIS